MESSNLVENSHQSPLVKSVSSLCFSVLYSLIFLSNNFHLYISRSLIFNNVLIEEEE